MTDKSIVRCVIYTRTSSDDGLGQDYNSLAAQRDACSAFILSQKSEGWVQRNVYEDGGHSGGSLDRPALQYLLADLAAGEFDIIVVYKIDRLTRSLRDFAKLSEVLEKQNVSFVAVTQQFNTASSMGRLTLNVLLTFAQFEREMAADRIRDKSAASARKGIWMGGHPALGYDAPNKRLVVNPQEANVVRHIFKRFTELESMSALRRDLEQSGIVSKIHISKDGVRTGGNQFSWHPLHSILTNPLYRGMIRRNGNLYPGRHEPIIDDAQFERVQLLVKEVGDREKQKRDLAYPSLLRGILFGRSGERLSPSHTLKKSRKYNYYITSAFITRVSRKKARDPKTKVRFSAPELDKCVVDLLVRHLRDRNWICSIIPTTRFLRATLKNAENLASAIQRQLKNRTGLIRELIERAEVDRTTVHLWICRRRLYEWLDIRLSLSAPPYASSAIEIELIGHSLRSGNDFRAVIEDQNASPEPDHRMIQEVLRAIRWFNELSSGTYDTMLELAEVEQCCPSLVSDRIRLAFLAPDIVEMILDGTQPHSMTCSSLMRACPLPLSWEEQRRVLLGHSSEIPDVGIAS